MNNNQGMCLVGMQARLMSIPQCSHKSQILSPSRLACKTSRVEARPEHESYELKLGERALANKCIYAPHIHCKTFDFRSYAGIYLMETDAQRIVVVRYLSPAIHLWLMSATAELLWQAESYMGHRQQGSDTTLWRCR